MACRSSRLSLRRLLAALLFLALAGCDERPQGSQKGSVQGSAEELPEATKTATLTAPLEEAIGTVVRISPGELHRYHFEVAAAELVHLEVDQRGIDLVARLVGEVGEPLYSDRRVYDRGREILVKVADSAETWTLEVETYPDERPAGEYSIEIVARRAAAGEDRLLAEAFERFSDAERKRLLGNAEAQASYRGALRLFRVGGEALWEAATLERLGTLSEERGEWERASEHYQGALELYRRAGDRRFQGYLLHKLGTIELNRDRVSSALALYREALPLRQSGGDRYGEAMTRHSLGQALRARGEPQQALDEYRRALDLWDAKSESWERSHTIHNLGVLYAELGRSERALDLLLEAGRAWSELGNERELAAALSRIGQLQAERGDLAAAQESHRESLRLRRKHRDPRGEVVALRNLGEAQARGGELDAAVATLRQALELVEAMSAPRTEAEVRRVLAGLLADPVESQRHLIEALELFRRVGDPYGEAETLMASAEALRRADDLDQALATSLEALELFAELRPRTVRLDLRSSFFAGVQRHFERVVDLLMELEDRRPGQGYASVALEVSERGRSRLLLDLLAVAGSEMRADADPDLLERESELVAEIHRRETRRLRLADREDAEGAAAAQRRTRELLEELAALRANVRASSPRFEALHEGRAATLRQIREQLDEDTLLVEMRLGEERSFAWLVRRRTLGWAQLAGRVEIEAGARVAYRQLMRSHRREARSATREALCELSRLLLAPLAGAFEDVSRIAFVADGALHYLPLGALPAPASECDVGRPLVATHEVVYLPSASFLTQRSSAGEGPDRGLLAVVADPVFSRDDPRLVGSAAATAGQATSGAAQRSLDEEPLDLARLEFSGLEAERILALAPPGQRLAALAFDARRELLLDGSLDGYRIVHLATHGQLDARHPELSGLVFSQVDPAGRVRPGFVRAHEIFNLQLRSDLVVLSACETALGAEIRGEGLVGLTQGFLSAGARRVLVSLWKVSDRSTAELMESFYSGLLERALTPVEALRRAQLRLAEDERTAAPFHWAGFVMLGEWSDIRR